MVCLLSGAQTGLLVSYNYNQGIPNADNTGINTLLDGSGNAFDATLTNFALNGTTSNWITTGAYNTAYATITSSGTSVSLGGNVTFTPTMDGSALTGTTFNTTGKRTALHFFKTDVYGQDLSAVLQGAADFELWDVLPPSIVQMLPMVRQFDQIGPIELFRYGTLKKFEVRLVAFGGTTIPYTIYLEDTSSVTGNITVVDGKEQVYDFNISRLKAGTMLRIELGPTSFNFHKIYARMLCAKSGADTENTWVYLEQQ